MRKYTNSLEPYEHRSPNSAAMLLLLPLFFLLGWFASAFLQPGRTATGGQAGVGGAPGSVLDLITPTSFPTTPTPTGTIMTPTPMPSNNGEILNQPSTSIEP